MTKKNILFSIFFLWLMLMLPKLINEDIQKPYAAVTGEEWREIQVSLNDYKLINEKFQIEIDKYGNVVSINSKQQPIVDLLLNRQFVPQLDSNENPIQAKIELKYKDRSLSGLSIANFIKIPRAGKIYSLIKLSRTSNQNKLDKLYSKKILQTIRNSRDSLRIKLDLISKWKLDNEELDVKIQDSKYIDNLFVIEKGYWKLNVL